MSRNNFSLWTLGYAYVSLSGTRFVASQEPVGVDRPAAVVLRPAQVSRQNLEKVSQRSHRHRPQKC